MKTVQPASALETGRHLSDLKLVGLSFAGWGAVFGYGSLLVSEQLAKLFSGLQAISAVTAFVIGLVVFLLLFGVHLLRNKTGGSTPSYSLKALVLPFLLVVVEFLVAWLYRI